MFLFESLSTAYFLRASTQFERDFVAVSEVYIAYTQQMTAGVVNTRCSRAPFLNLQRVVIESIQPSQYITKRDWREATHWLSQLSNRFYVISRISRVNVRKMQVKRDTKSLTAHVSIALYVRLNRYKSNDRFLRASSVCERRGHRP